MNSVVTVQTASAAWFACAALAATCRALAATLPGLSPGPAPSSPFSLSLPLHSFSFSLAEPDTATTRSHCRCHKYTVATTPSSGSKTYSCSNLAWVTPSLSSPQALTGSPSSVAVRRHGSSSSPVPRPGCCWLQPADQGSGAAGGWPQPDPSAPGPTPTPPLLADPTTLPLHGVRRREVEEDGVNRK